MLEADDEVNLVRPTTAASRYAKKALTKTSNARSIMVHSLGDKIALQQLYK